MPFLTSLSSVWASPKLACVLSLSNYFTVLLWTFITPLTSNILSFHRLGRPGGMNPVCFLRSTIRRSIFSSRSMIRTTDTSMVGSRRTVTMDRCSTIHNCLASSSDNPWTWKGKRRDSKLCALNLWLLWLKNSKIVFDRIQLHCPPER